MPTSKKLDTVYVLLSVGAGNGSGARVGYWLV